MILTKWILEELDEKVDLINEKLKNKNDENVTTFRTNELEPTVKSVDNLIQTIKKYQDEITPNIDRSSIPDLVSQNIEEQKALISYNLVQLYLGPLDLT